MNREQPRCSRVGTSRPKAVPGGAPGAHSRERPVNLERGSGSILGVAIIAAVLATVLLLVPLYTVLATKQRIAGAADAAALAAADVAVGITPGIPCEVAASLARANGAAVSACQVDGLVATIRVGTIVLGFAVSATATAGPPGT